MKISRGFSVLEMLIAMAIVLVAITAVTLSLYGGNGFLIGGQENAEALHLAETELEQVQANARQDFRLVTATTSIQTIGGIAYTTTVTIGDATPKDFFTKNVTAQVTWRGQYGVNPSVSLSALVTNFQGAVGGDTCSPSLSGNWKAPIAVASSIATLVADANSNDPYPVTDVDAYQGKLYVAVATSSSSAGTRNPVTGADNSGIGNITWLNPSRVTAKDNSVASVSVSGTNTTHYLKATNFGFTIPQGSTILGIKVDVYRNASGQSGSNAVIDKEVKIVRADGTVGSQNKASATQWTTTAQTDASYGGTTDLWSEAGWTPAGINNANFGAVIAVTGSSASANRTANVDSIQITVYYTKSFYIMSLSNPAAPTFVGGLATSTLTNGINALAVATSSAGNFAYLATNNAGINQLQIIDITDPTAPFATSTYPSSLAGIGMGAGTGDSIFYRDGYAYVGLTHSGTGDEFNIIDVTKAGAPRWVGGYAVGDYVNAIYVKDGYAYLTTNNTNSNRELMILNIQNPAAPSLVATYAGAFLSGWGYGRGLSVVGSTVYLGRSWTNSGSIPQFLALDNGTPPPVLSTSKSLGTNLSLNGIVVRDSLAFLLTGSGTNGGSLQIVNATSTALVASATLNPNAGTGVGGVALDCEGNYLYAASVDSTSKGYITSITAP